jgi:putative FmdB family regulatory protein
VGVPLRSVFGRSADWVQKRREQMPVYDYLCEDCGPFTVMRPMAEFDLPHECPQCETEAPRALLTAPYCSSVSQSVRTANAVNERSANSPRSSKEYGAKHGSSCSCCTGKSKRTTLYGKKGEKSFPTSRPWMISH